MVNILSETIRVLLVDDDPGDRALARLALDKTPDGHFSLDTASSLKEASRRLSESHYDVLLLDLGLPESSGTDTLERVRAVDRQIPIVVLTDLTDERAALTSLDKGAQDFLLKSNVAADSLSRAIRYAVHRQQLLKELGNANTLLEHRNERLEQLCDTAQKFVDNVSHEFRTPLTVIKEYVSLLRDGIVGTTELDPEQHRFLDVIADRADDLNTMVDDMLDVSKLEAGLLSMWRRNCSVAEIIDHVRISLEKKAEVKRVSLHIDIPPQLPEVYCDPEKVGRIIINLAVNAIKFTSDPGKVRIWAKSNPAASEVMIGVTDNGPGIDQTQLCSIFERFRQLSARARGTSKGFGLGLSIAKELVDLNLGELYVESQIGVGSTFQFTLPVADPEHVLCRYLRTVGQGAGPHPSAVSVLTAEVDGADAQGTCDEEDAFLGYVLRGNDLLFSNHPEQWVLVMQISAAELQNFIDRVNQTRDELNRNRLEGPLPRLVIEHHGTWCAEQETRQVLACVNNLLRMEDPVHV